MKILIVDDSVYMLELLEIFFSSETYEVYTALNGRKALSLIEQHSFVVIITDLNMPQMNGIMLAFNLRKLLPEIPVILFSSDLTVPIRYKENLAEIGNALFIGEKNIKKLLEAVKKITVS